MVKVYDLNGNAKGEMKLPKVFAGAYRPDLIQRAVQALQAARRRAYGTNLLAGQRTSAHYHGVKDTRYSMKNREVARGPRIHGGPSGLQWTLRTAPHTRKGRRSHPPKAEKKFVLKLNKKENRLAIAAAIAASIMKDLVSARGHKFAGELPLIAVNDVENLSKAKDVSKFLSALKLDAEIERATEKKVRAGKGKNRGRKYKQKKSVLFVVSKESALLKAARNLAGVDAVSVSQLNVELLAPGAQPGRLAIWSEDAICKIGEIDFGQYTFSRAKGEKFG